MTDKQVGKRFVIARIEFGMPAVLKTFARQDDGKILRGVTVGVAEIATQQNLGPGEQIRLPFRRALQGSQKVSPGPEYGPVYDFELIDLWGDPCRDESGHDILSILP